MLIPKQKRKELVDNPFRPKIGLPKSHTSCKLSWSGYWVAPDEQVDRIRVCADDNEEFFALIDATIPEEDRYRCQDREVYLIDGKWKKFLVDTAKEYYDEVKTELRTW